MTRQRQETEDKRKGKRTGEGYLARDKGPALDREETDRAHRQMAIYEGKNCIRMS